MHNRLTSVLCKVFSSTADDRLNLLRRFEFGGSRCTLSNTLCGNYSSHIDMASGTAMVEVAGFRPDRLVRRPSGATHMKFHMVFAAVDFEHGEVVRDSIVSDAIDLEAAWTEAFTLQAELPSGYSGSGFLAFGVSFYDGDSALGGGAAVLADVAAAVIEKPQPRCKTCRIPRIAVTFMPERSRGATSRRRKSATRRALLKRNVDLYACGNMQNIPPNYPRMLKKMEIDAAGCKQHQASPQALYRLLRQLNKESTTTTGRTFTPDRSTMRLDDLPGNRQPETK
jgi:hypothetical protein